MSQFCDNTVLIIRLCQEIKWIFLHNKHICVNETIRVSQDASANSNIFDTPKHKLSPKLDIITRFSRVSSLTLDDLKDFDCTSGKKNVEQLIQISKNQ